MLANRLKNLLPHVVSESQSAIQYDKTISDNILVAFEMLHHMKIKKRGNEEFMAMKLDMSKAYDWLSGFFGAIDAEDGFPWEMGRFGYGYN